MFLQFLFGKISIIRETLIANSQNQKSKIPSKSEEIINCAKWG